MTDILRLSITDAPGEGWLQEADADGMFVYYREHVEMMAAVVAERDAAQSTRWATEAKLGLLREALIRTSARELPFGHPAGGGACWCQCPPAHDGTHYDYCATLRAALAGDGDEGIAP